MEIRSEAFDHNSPIPIKYTCEGEDISPPLFWSKGPTGTRSYVIICDDPDAPRGIFHHWGAYDIPADETSVLEGVAPRTEDYGIKQAENDFNNIGYGGPCPPHGDEPHRYRFRVLALKIASLEFDRTPTILELERMARPHVAAEAVLVGRFGRK